MENTLINQGNMPAIPVNEIVIPDLWHIAMAIKDGDHCSKADGAEVSKMILETWHQAHFLQRHIQETTS